MEPFRATCWALTVAGMAAPSGQRGAAATHLTWLDGCVLIQDVGYIGPITFDQLVDRARSLVTDGHRALLGVTGPPGAGKTTLTEQLIQVLAPAPPPGLTPHQWIAHVSMDGFHLADAELARLHRHDRKGAPDTFDPAGYAALLRRLREDGDDVVYAPSFERTLEQPIAGAIPIPPAARLIITEGNYLLCHDHGWDRVRPQLDEVWYVDLDTDERLRRLTARHIRFGKSPAAAAAWATGPDERNAVLITATRPRADLIIPAGSGCPSVADGNSE